MKNLKNNHQKQRISLWVCWDPCHLAGHGLAQALTLISCRHLEIRSRVPVFQQVIAGYKSSLAGVSLGCHLGLYTSCTHGQRQGWLNDPDLSYDGRCGLIPTIALAPILVLWLGYGICPDCAIILTTTFPIIVQYSGRFSAL